MATQHLTRSRSDRVIAGVAGGLGHYLDVDPLLVRLMFVLLTITAGAGILIYIAAIIIIPEEKEERMDEQQAAPGTAGAPDTPAPPATEPEPTAATVAVPSSANPFLAPSVPEPGPDDTEKAPGQSTAATTATEAAPPPAPPLPPAAPPSPQPTLTPPPETHDEQHRRRRTAFGVVLICLGILFLIQQFVPQFDWGRFWPVLLIGLGAYLLLKERDI